MHLGVQKKVVQGNLLYNHRQVSVQAELEFRAPDSWEILKFYM